MSHGWMPFYVADYRNKTAHLSTAEHGAYMLLIMHYWASGSLPDDDAQLARITVQPLPSWRKMKSSMQAFFYDGWKHHRIEEELEKAAIKHSRRVEAGKRGGEAKANGKQCSGNATRLLAQSDSNALASSSQLQTQLEEPQSNLHPLHPEPQNKILSFEKSNCEKGVKEENLEIPTFLKREPEALPPKPPRHAAITPDKRFVYFKRGTKEFEAYEQDYREATGEEPQATSDGRWFKVLGESFLHNGKAKAANPNGYGMVDENGA